MNATIQRVIQIVAVTVPDERRLILGEISRLAKGRPMSNTRASELANRIEQGADALARFAESLSDSEWHTLVPNDQRSVGVLVHHIASSYPMEIDLAQGMAAGNAIVGVTWDVANQMNAQHAHDHADIGQSEAIALLRQNSKVAAERVRQFTDLQLDTAVTVSLNAGAPLTVQFFIEDHALRHSFHHLANIRAALRR